MIEQRAVDHRTEPCLVYQPDDLVERDVTAHLYTHALKHCRISIDALNPKLGGPIGSVIPGPAGEADRSDALLDRFDLLEQISRLPPALPGLADIDHAVFLLTACLGSP